MTEPRNRVSFRIEAAKFISMDLSVFNLLHSLTAGWRHRARDQAGEEAARFDPARTVDQHSGAGPRLHLSADPHH